MDKLVKVFESAEFGQVRTIEENGKVLFVGSDVAKALGYVKPQNAVSAHCKGALKRGIPTNGGLQDMLIIPEGDLYRLIVNSKLPAAEKFESWVFDEVLPSIRQTGGYQKPMSELEILAGSVKQLLEQQKRIDELEQNQQVQSRQISSIKEVAVYRPDNEWRDSTKKLINKMVDGDFAKIREIRKEAYNLLENRMGVLLETRLRNKRRRLLEEGVSRTKANELNYLDVIADDKKLIEGFVAIIKEMSIRYGVAA